MFKLAAVELHIPVDRTALLGRLHLEFLLQVLDERRGWVRHVRQLDLSE
jgi:hypothetical protein